LDDQVAGGVGQILRRLARSGQQIIVFLATFGADRTCQLRSYLEAVGYGLNDRQSLTAPA